MGPITRSKVINMANIGKYQVFDWTLIHGLHMMENTKKQLQTNEMALWTHKSDDEKGAKLHIIIKT
jgi:hypothetical protein